MGLSGLTEMTIPILLIVGKVAERAAQKRLDSWLASSGTSSIRQALHGNRTLGGDSYYLRVTEARNYGVHTKGEVDFLAVEIMVDVIAGG
jgi:hypothetical protein